MVTATHPLHTSLTHQHHLDPPQGLKGCQRHTGLQCWLVQQLAGPWMSSADQHTTADSPTAATDAFPPSGACKAVHSAYSSRTLQGPAASRPAGALNSGKIFQVQQRT
jgi:hypothetical protein